MLIVTDTVVQNPHDPFYLSAFGSACLCYAPEMKPLIQLKSLSPVGMDTCMCSASSSCQAVTVTCSRHAQQAASRVVLSTCCVITTPPNEDHSPCISRAASITVA